MVGHVPHVLVVVRGAGGVKGHAPCARLLANGRADNISVLALLTHGRSYRGIARRGARSATIARERGPGRMARLWQVFVREREVEA